MGRKAKNPTDFDRIRLWNTGKYVRPTERIKCNHETCRRRTSIREFDFGFFCRDCFMEAPECSSPGCKNPAIVGAKFDSGGRCRTCEFEYDGRLEIYLESNLSQEAVFSHTKDIHTKEFRDGLRAGMEKVGVKRVDPRKEWFPRVD